MIVPLKPLGEASFISSRVSATHPCIHCDSISDLCSWRTKVQYPCDLSAILFIKNQPVLYIGNSWNGVHAEDVINAWEGGREGQFITVHGCRWNNSNSLSIMHCLCYYVLPNLFSPLPVYIARTVRLKLQKEIYIENSTQEYDIYLLTCSLCPLSTHNLNILPRSETTRHSIKVHWRYCIKWDIHICHRKSPRYKDKFCNGTSVDVHIPILTQLLT